MVTMTTTIIIELKTLHKNLKCDFQLLLMMKVISLIQRGIEVVILMLLLSPKASKTNDKVYLRSTEIIILGKIFTMPLEKEMESDS